MSELQDSVDNRHIFDEPTLQVSWKFCVKLLPVDGTWWNFVTVQGSLSSVEATEVSNGQLPRQAQVSWKFCVNSFLLMGTWWNFVTVQGSFLS